jgi:hypothetical protein
MIYRLLICTVVFTLLALFTEAEIMNAQQTYPTWMKSSQDKMTSELVNKFGESQRSRIERGLKQVGDFWRSEDGDATVFEDFTALNFAGDQTTLDEMFNRYEYLFEKLYGHMAEISRELKTQTDLDRGPVQPFDEVFAGYDPSAHVTDDMFANKQAFVVLLNFPLTTLDQKLTEGQRWTRRQWAETRLADIFSKRIPADVNLEIARTSAEADRYISDYNIWMYHLVDENGNRLFPPKMRLLSHWNLRDQIKADYSSAKDQLAKQRMIQKVMDRIVDQSIPKIVINNPNVDWNPYTNEVKAAAMHDADVATLPELKIDNSPEPDARYTTLLSTFKASQKLDAYSPTAPTLIERRFNESREIPESRVQSMFEQILTSDAAKQVAALIEKRLGRPLEPFDIWYNGFRPRGKYTEPQLDEIVAKKYPTADAYKKAIPEMLKKLEFKKDRAKYLADNIIVDPARGSGHALGAVMRTEKAHLRTRVEKSGMNYKGYNIAIHEMGHNVEQTFSLNDIDYWSLQGVPNTAFTEAIAFVFQGHDLDLLGLTAPDAQSEALKVLNDYWAVYEIAGVALIDMQVWHWMYDHPNATPGELKQATITISKEIWNKYYAPVFKINDIALLGIYSHMIDSYMYLPDYPLGHLIAFQIEEHIKKTGTIGPEIERMTKIGRVAPDIWMKTATGAPVGAEAILEATQRALKQMNAGSR